MIIILQKITFNITANTKPNIIIEPSNAGNGINASPFFKPSSTMRNIADTIKQQLQINTILENVRKV